jgi:Mn-dependent DtxR family transcriptional regulator
LEDYRQDNEDFVPEYLSRLEESVLEELSVREKNYNFRFNGLRRLLRDVHQQKLTRALERLQEDRLIQQSPDGGYGLGNETYDKVREYFDNQGLVHHYQEQNKDLNRILTTITSEKEIPVENLIKRLAGKYFGYYRFVGHYSTNKKGRLEWIHVEDHSKILISTISEREIEIESYNVNSNTIERFIQLIRQIMVNHHIFLQIREKNPSHPN